jgi:hypothetical protein
MLPYKIECHTVVPRGIWQGLDGGRMRGMRGGGGWVKVERGKGDACHFLINASVYFCGYKLLLIKDFVHVLLIL